jgi:hypothetical protein
MKRMRKAGLKQLVRAAHNPQSALVDLGPRRAVIQCRHRSGFTVAEVRDDLVVTRGVRHDLIRTSYDVWVGCDRCGVTTGRRVLDLAKIRDALAGARWRPLKLDVDEVTRAAR